jgi:hypothetical protein
MKTFRRRLRRGTNSVPAPPAPPESFAGHGASPGASSLPASSGASSPPASPSAGNLPTPPSERGPWLLAGGIAAFGAAALAAVLTGLIGGTRPAVTAAAPPPVPFIVPTPAPAASASISRTGGDPPGGVGAARASGNGRRAGRRTRGRGAGAQIVAQPSSAQQSEDLTRFVDQTQTRISARWMEGFYPIYAVAQRTFGVNWLLLASIHRQESAFSTAPTTYSGLNFAGCCGGPMQFNVRNGRVTTWDLVSNSYIYGPRPAVYDHQTATHPSIYDDFDAIMAAAHLLSADGAELALDGAAWNAAYDYYGHDLTGVAYADEVLARAIGWSQHGFCVNCGTEQTLIEAVHAAYGAPVQEALTAARIARAAPTSKHKR